MPAHCCTSPLAAVARDDDGDVLMSPVADAATTAAARPAALRMPCWLLRLPLLGLYLNPLLQLQRMYMMLHVSLLRLCVLML